MVNQYDKKGLVALLLLLQQLLTRYNKLNLTLMAFPFSVVDDCRASVLDLLEGVETPGAAVSKHAKDAAQVVTKDDVHKKEQLMRRVQLKMSSSWALTWSLRGRGTSGYTGCPG